MATISTATDIEIENGKLYLITASGGSVQLQRTIGDGTLVDIEGSPLADGEEKEMRTQTEHPQKKIKVTPSTTMDFSMTLID
jgi:hypothetical protein